METNCLVQITETVAVPAQTVAPNTGREASAGEERNWESFPQPAGWSLHWDNDGLLKADPVPGLPGPASEDVDPPTETKR
jgi:hypothetical protein